MRGCSSCPHSLKVSLKNSRFTKIPLLHRQKRGFSTVCGVYYNPLFFFSDYLLYFFFLFITIEPPLTTSRAIHKARFAVSLVFGLLADVPALVLLFVVVFGFVFPAWYFLALYCPGFVISRFLYLRCYFSFSQTAIIS